jgi:uncharacterized membrane protein YhiD involved in acid resistance
MEMLDISSLVTTVQNPTIISITYSICLSFVLSSLVSITYQKTFQGLSYSRNYVQALILASIVATIAMQAIGDNLARGLGMMGALAIVRFRSSLKDPKDMIFIFMALAVGIACGVYSFSIAAIGTIGFSIAATIIHALPFSKESHFDGLLKFNLGDDKEDKQQLENILSTSCNNFALITLREVGQGTRLDYAYQIKLNARGKFAEFVEDLQELKTIKGVNLLLQESTVEI